MRFVSLTARWILVFIAAETALAGNILQRHVNHLMHGQTGVVIVSNPNNGNILALWNRELAFSHTFPPGSTAKLVVAAAALEEGLIAFEDKLHCRQIPKFLGEPYRCSHEPHDAAFTLVSALGHSCNCFFANLGLRLTSETLAHWYGVLGLGETKAGRLLPDSTRQPLDQDSAPARALAGLGEGTVLVTPAQLLLAYSGVAVRGPVYALWERPPENKQTPQRWMKLRPETFQLLEAGLETCVREGTCTGAYVPGIRVAGKTGTTRFLNPNGRTQAWFVGYAPAGRPEIALVVLLEGGSGRRNAAPLAGEILKHYFAAKRRPQ